MTHHTDTAQPKRVEKHKDSLLSYSYKRSRGTLRVPNGPYGAAQVRPPARAALGCAGVHTWF